MLKIKPHHFIDIITKFGDGCEKFNPHPYGHAVHSVAEEILADRDIDICIELGIDDICLPCSHNIDGRCDDIIDVSFRPQAPESKHDYNLIIDMRWCERLGLLQDEQLTAREFCLRIRDYAGDIEDIYRETPVDRTLERQGKMRKGIAKFLEQAK